MQHEREFWLKREFLTNRFISGLPGKIIIPLFWKSLKMGWRHHCLVAEVLSIVSKELIHSFDTMISMENQKADITVYRYNI